MEVPLVKLSNGRTMPAVGFGTWRCDPDKLAEVVATALRAGVRHIDTAGIYRNEGRWAKRSLPQSAAACWRARSCLSPPSWE
jgi:diketogulonate reductase-like aldo/keto reductase